MIKIVVDEKQLKQRSKRVSIWAGVKTGKKLIKFIQEQNIDCAGLSAPQIDIKQRVFVMTNGAGGFEIFINPQVVEKGVLIAEEVEGCLSLPGRKFVVSRPVSISVVDELRKNPIEIGGITARVFMHELDHLNGILISEIGKEVKIEGQNQ